MSQRPNIEELLCDYLDGTLDAHRQRQLEALLQRHAKLRKVLAEMQQARGMLRDLPLEQMPAAASAELQDQLREPAPASFPLYAHPGLLRLAAAIALAVTGGLALWAILPSNSPTAARTVAMDVATPAPTARPMTESLASKAGPAEAQATEAEDAGAGENEPAVMVVLADDIRGTQRQIRDILTSNNISYESVSPPSDVREQARKESLAQPMAKAADPAPAQQAPALGGLAGPMPAAPAAAPAPAPMAKAEAARPLAARASGATESEALAEKPGQQELTQASKDARETRDAREAEPSPDTMQAIARAVQTARQANAASAGAAQQQAATANTQASDTYGVVVARNVTSDQLGRIRSGLQNASRSRNLRVVDAPLDRNSQTAFSRDQAPNRADTEYPFQQQAQVQAQTQNRLRQGEQQQQQMAFGPEPQRRISYSPRYDLTIVVQGETAANAEPATRAHIPVWPSTRTSSTLPSTSPAQH